MTWSKPRQEVRDPWYRAVIKSNLSNATKLLLVVMVDDMKVYGEVSVPRSKLAEKLGVQPRRITERIKEAVDAGWLAVLVRGQPGTTAEYVAAFPVGTDVRAKRRRRRDPRFLGTDARTNRPADMVPKTDPSDGADVRPSAERGHGAHVQPPNTTHPPFTDSLSVAGEDTRSSSLRDGEAGAAVGGEKTAMTRKAAVADLPSPADSVRSGHSRSDSTTNGGCPECTAERECLDHLVETIAHARAAAS